MPFIIDAHEDLAFNHVNYQRDYRRSAAETRQRENDSYIIEETDDTLLGWPEYQKGQVALVFGTIYIVPARHDHYPTTKAAYRNADDVRQLYEQQMDYYRRLDQSSEDMFRLVRTRSDLTTVLAPWRTQPASYPDQVHPVGILMSIEGLEGIGKIQDIEYYWDQGVRAIGPVWAGGRFCGGTMEHGGFTNEGYELLKIMSRSGFMLDLSHMTDLSARQALDAYEGSLIASHANARALLGSETGERHFTDEVIRHLAERGGTMGIVPYNRFLKDGWSKLDPAGRLPLETVANQMDYICQLTGSASHVSLGTDFDGGFGLQSVPAEINSISDLQKLEGLLKERGYAPADIEKIFSGNWQRILEKALPV